MYKVIGISRLILSKLWSFMEKYPTAYVAWNDLCDKAAKQEDPNVLTIAAVYQLALKLCAAKMLLSIRNLMETLMCCNVWDIPGKNFHLKV